MKGTPGDRDIRGVIDALREELDALTTVIEYLEARYPLHSRPPVGERPARSARHRPDRPRRRPSGFDAGVSPLIAARDHAILAFMKQHPIVRRDQLLKALPKELNQSTLQREHALRNALTRLRAKNLIGRTGDTYSVVGRSNE